MGPCLNKISLSRGESGVTVIEVLLFFMFMASGNANIPVMYVNLQFVRSEWLCICHVQKEMH